MRVRATRTAILAIWCVLAHVIGVGPLPLLTHVGAASGTRVMPRRLLASAARDGGSPTPTAPLSTVPTPAPSTTASRAPAASPQPPRASEVGLQPALLPQNATVTVPAASTSGAVWIATGLTVTAGQLLTATARGSWSPASASIPG